MLWDKIKRTRITKIASGYAVVGWILLQAIETILPTFNSPEWIAQTLVFFCDHTRFPSRPAASLGEWPDQAFRVAISHLDHSAT